MLRIVVAYGEVSKDFARAAFLAEEHLFCTQCVAHHRQRHAHFLTAVGIEKPGPVVGRYFRIVEADDGVWIVNAKLFPVTFDSRL